jgi:hypothetical protein
LHPVVIGSKLKTKRKRKCRISEIKTLGTFEIGGCVPLISTPLHRRSNLRRSLKSWKLKNSTFGSLKN